jgi:hypothetical protein
MVETDKGVTKSFAAGAYDFYLGPGFYEKPGKKDGLISGDAADTQQYFLPSTIDIINSAGKIVFVLAVIDLSSMIPA